MPQSSPTVFVMVEDDLKPDLIGTLPVPRPGKTVKIAVKSLAGVGSLITATWEDSPTNLRPKLVWAAGTKLALGIYTFRFRTDDGGSEQWSFPLEDPHTLIVTAKTGT